MIHKGTLTIIEAHPNVLNNGGGHFVVKCTCGNTFKAYKSRWENFSGLGCGKCFRTRGFTGKHNPKYRHGGTMEKKLEMNSYRGMMMRCYYPKYRAYHRYGGRGITVCDRWTDKINGFANFYADMGPKPTPKHSIDRIDNNGNYEPSNCRWATQLEQSSNKG